MLAKWSLIILALLALVAGYVFATPSLAYSDVGVLQGTRIAVEDDFGLHHTQMADEHIAISHQDKQVPSGDYFVGDGRETKPGHDGVKVITYRLTFQGTRQIAKNKVREVTIKQPLNGEYTFGTKDLPALAQAAPQTVYYTDPTPPPVAPPTSIDCNSYSYGYGVNTSCNSY